MSKRGTSRDSPWVIPRECYTTSLVRVSLVCSRARANSFFFSFSRSRNEADRPKRENGKMGALRFCANAERQTERRRARTRNVVILCCVYSVLRVSSASRCARKRPRVFIFLLLGLFLSSLLFFKTTTTTKEKRNSHLVELRVYWQLYFLIRFINHYRRRSRFRH